MTLAIALFCAASLSALLYAERSGDARLKWLAKPLASAAFVAFALASGALSSAYGRLILAGLACCLVGDVFLIATAKRAFLAGMAAFAAGHLAYIGAFATIWAGPSLLLVAAAFAMAATIVIVLIWLQPGLQGFRAPVSAYCVIIGVMTAMSFGTQGPAGAPYWAAAAGAVGFAASDVAVARDQFLNSGFANHAWGLPLYYGAQMLLAASVSFRDIVN